MYHMYCLYVFKDGEPMKGASGFHHRITCISCTCYMYCIILMEIWSATGRSSGGWRFMSHLLSPARPSVCVFRAPLHSPTDLLLVWTGAQGNTLSFVALTAKLCWAGMTGTDRCFFPLCTLLQSQQHGSTLC